MERTSVPSQIVSVILAAGKGSRMNSPHLHKVCYQIDGRPVIARAIDIYKQCGVDMHFVVIGEVLGQVVQAASMGSSNISFCYQNEQLGTGHATKCAVDQLKALDFEGGILVVAGDKVVEESAIRKLVEVYRETQCDLAILVTDTAENSTAGRIVCKDNRPVGIVESVDAAKLHVLNILKKLTRDNPVSAAEAESLALAYFKSETKANTALGQLWKDIKQGKSVTAQSLASVFTESDYTLKLNGLTISHDQISGAGYSNTSIYLFNSTALYAALEKLQSANAQGEVYLTDTIGILASESADIRLVAVDYPEQVLAFNTQEEFRKIEDYIAGRKSISVNESPRTIRRASEWLQRFEHADCAVSHLRDIYGEDHALVENRRKLLVSMLRSYVNHYADDEVVITRAPGRLNIMGRHVDSQGGHTNLMAIDKDLYLVAGIRQDRQVYLHNLNAREMPQRAFDTDDVLANYNGGDWLEFVDSDQIRARAQESRGDWSQYVTAPVARFQAKYPNMLLKGLNIVAAGDIPMAAGLSSSSAVVVAVAEAIAHVNDIDISPEQFVELCGEGEWYVGTRGGSADHAAMKFAKIGKVIHVGFHPFHLVDEVPFPKGYEFLVCNSHLKAHKTGSARDTFNHRIACYYIARDIFKAKHPDYADQIEHVRDINTRNLGVSYPELLKMLLKVPAVISRQELAGLLSEEQTRKYLGSHSSEFEEYPLRAVLIFGLAECERSRTCPELLLSSRMRDFGKLMNVSHDGDRVVRWKSGEQMPAIADYSDQGMAQLIEDAENNVPGSELIFKPGGYSCSIPEIDKMVDIAQSKDYVLGAQMLGAGLGGCMAILVKTEDADRAMESLIEEYYQPAELTPEIFRCRPIAGSRVIRF